MIPYLRHPCMMSSRGKVFPVGLIQRIFPGGASWPKAITAAIRQSHNFILIFSESTGTSEFVLNQLMLAKSSGLKIIVILTGNSDLPYKYDLYMDTAYFICAFEYKKIIQRSC